MPRFQLLIDRVQDGLLVVTNCCDEDVPIRTVLTVLYAKMVRRIGDTFESQPYGDPQAVSLTIEASEILHKQIDCVPRGYTAGIRVLGSGMDAVQKQLSIKGKEIQLFLGGE